MNNDIEFLIDTMGDTVSINDAQHKALVTHSNVTNHEERYIHTLKQIKQGDLITYDNEKYLIVNETVTKRANKYKALMRHCNYSIVYPGKTEQVLLVDENGNPILDIYGDEQYITVETDPINIFIIADNESMAVIGTQLMIVENHILITVQDNETNRDKLKVNSTFSAMDYKWKIMNVDKTQRGLLIITCDRND
ncbi:hypothetical protein ACIQ4I_15335 [Rummeliibacillus sp. NPDC094406]|uniref:hypothetical protein n=1 Tax=Rummeliibacillus sp. NPDC094406 TaxID=3364511 RepID=UPI0038295950